MKLWRALLVTVLLLCATLCVTSVTAAADDSTHTHPICGESHTDIGDHTGECGDVEWTAWDGISAIDYGDSNTAYVYLTGSATRNYKLEIRGGYTLYLCLNGFSITSSEDGLTTWDTVVTVYDKAKFVLCDCKNDAGMLTHSSGMHGKGVRVGQGSDAVFIMYGGTISGNHIGNSNNDGAGVEIQNGTFKMYGGKITDNHIDATSYYGGGGVCAQSGGKFIMYGGEISNNTSNDDGGGIVAWGGSASLYGGTISGNTSGNNGGGICTNSNLIISGNVRIADNTAANGKGGGVYFNPWGSGNLTISDSVIFANNTAMDGGGIYINEGGLTINGGSITNNTATGNGGGVYFGGSSFKISGNTGITGNKKNSDANNIYLPNGKRINVEGELTGTVPIGVTTEATPNSSEYVQIASGSAEYATPDKFQYENSNTPISIVSSWYGVTLVVCVHNFGTDWKTDAANHWRECSICKGQDGLSAHIGGSSTCTEKAVCEVCGLPYGNVLSHDFNGGTWQSNADEHWKKCSNCDAVDAKSPHEWNDGEVTLNPTCTTIGQKTFTCTVCHAVKIETLNALGHNLLNHNAKEATCTEKGWKDYETCSRCDYTTYIEINALGHDEVPHEGKAATCTEDGCKPYVTCTRCDYTTYEKIDALGHDEVPHEGKAATCTKDGWKSYVTCTRCNYTTYEKIDALGHDEVPHEGKAATCTEDGWKPYVTCTRCDYTTYEKIDALGHDEVPHEGKAATCTEDGCKPYVICTRCDYTTYEKIDALGHNEVPHEGKAATCTEDGWKPYVTCTRCDYTTYEKIGALGHDEVPHEGKAATCTEDGWKPYVTCNRCDYTTYEKIDALGHDEVPHEGKAATCTEDGWKPYVTCTRCDYTTYEKIDALGHDFANGTWQSDSTMHWKKCSRCDAVNEKAQHVGSMTTCRDSAVCTICSTVYGVLNSDNHVGGIEIRGMIASTAEKAGYTGDIYCKGCNAKLCDGAVIPAISNLSTDMKSELATAAEAIEKVLNDQSGVYTDEQKKQLADSANAINSALESIENTEEAVKKVDAMPDVGSTQPDDKAAIDSYEAAKKAYEALSDDEKRMAGESVKAALDDMLRALTDYDVTYGNGSVWTENNNNNGLTFTVNGYHKKFAGIVINGAAVDEKYYEIAAGSTVITLKAEYLQTLPEGKYILQVQYTDGSTDGDDTFTITKSDSAAASDTTDSPPKTGDNSNLVLLISIITVCAVVLVILLLLFKKRKQETKE